jgi:hypothetical protein
MTSDICGDLSSHQLFSKDINIGGTAHVVAFTSDTGPKFDLDHGARKGGNARSTVSHTNSAATSS